jgi:pimeloyl-ACP methyl ester carboxylesterase
MAGGGRSLRSWRRASASSRPTCAATTCRRGGNRFTDYTADKVADDIRGLLRELGAESAMVVGHDWGGSVAWTLAMNHPEVVDRLVILNAAHPRKLNEGLPHPR